MNERVFHPDRGAADAAAKARRKGKAALIERYVDERIVRPAAARGGEEQEVTEALQRMSPEAKAVRIYEDIIAYVAEHPIGVGEISPGTPAAPDSYFISEISALWSDERARRIFLDAYGKARIDKLLSRKKGTLWRKIAAKRASIAKMRSEYAALKQDIVLGRITSPTALKAAHSKLDYRHQALQDLIREEDRMARLEGYEHITENTDAAAILMYGELQRYHREAKEGFAWLPSRRKIHERITEAIDHMGKAPLLIGPPGTGKTTQIEAVAQERTGNAAVRIPCNAGISEEGLVYLRDIKAGEGAYEYQGTVTEAATGYRHSRDRDPMVNHGRIALLDEISQLDADRALGPVKDIRQARPGKHFSRFAPYNVLPGFQLVATSNLPLTDERLEREFSRIPTNYFEMTATDPELYEFMLAKLLKDEGNLPLIAPDDIAPAYRRRDIPEDKRTVLKDGSKVVAVEELVEDPAHPAHGFLYRFAHMIRAIQDSYIHGSKFNEKHLANTAFYETTDDNGAVLIKGYITDLKSGTQPSPGGTMLKLGSGSSTITAETISKWMEGFAGSGETDLPQWLRKMFREHIDQTSPEDAERIQAIAAYFHIFEEKDAPVPVAGPAAPARKALPLTPKEIGYLSPRVPRPVYLERPQKENVPPAERAEKRPAEKYNKTREVRLDDSTGILMDIRNFAGSEGVCPEVKIGEKFMASGEEFILSGIVEDVKDPRHGQPIGKFTSEDLYKIFSPEEVDTGLLLEFQRSLENDIADMGKDVDDFCKRIKV